MAEQIEQTSIKGIIQELAGNGAEVVQGVVKSISPIKIQIAGDDKLVIGPNITYIPEHLTDYTVGVTVNWQTETASGGTGEGLYDPYNHSISGQKTITVHNSLRVGDRVHILSFCRGKQYYVLDRVG